MVSQPLSSRPSQSANGAGHVMAHVPAVHVNVVLAGVPYRDAHATAAAGSSSMIELQLLSMLSQISSATGLIAALVSSQSSEFSARFVPIMHPVVGVAVREP